MKFQITMTEAALGAVDFEKRQEGRAPKACGICGKDAGKDSWALWLGHGFKMLGKAPRPLCGVCIGFIEQSREIIAMYHHHSEWSRIEILPNKKPIIDLMNKHQAYIEAQQNTEQVEAYG